MTAILQPGDRVHLALGVDLRLSLERAIEAKARFLAEVEPMYAALGVTIVGVTITAGAAPAVILAVFRDPPAVRRRRRGHPR